MKREFCSYCGLELSPWNHTGFCIFNECRKLAAREMATDLATQVDTPPTEEEMNREMPEV